MAQPQILDGLAGPVILAGHIANKTGSEQLSGFIFAIRKEDLP